MNTPDAEWENDLRKRYRSQTLKMAREVSQTGDYSKVEGMIVDWWLKELTSRDTYWKERVRKTVGKIEESARTQDTSYEYGEGTYEGMMHSIFILKDITNEDNLK